MWGEGVVTSAVERECGYSQVSGSLVGGLYTELVKRRPPLLGGDCYWKEI